MFLPLCGKCSNIVEQNYESNYLKRIHFLFQLMRSIINLYHFFHSLISDMKITFLSFLVQIFMLLYLIKCTYLYFDFQGYYSTLHLIPTQEDVLFLFHIIEINITDLRNIYNFVISNINNVIVSQTVIILQMCKHSNICTTSV